MFRLALCQMNVGTDKKENIKRADQMIREGAKGGAKVISLPEIFNCPYSNKHFRQFAEDENGETVEFMRAISQELDIYLVGGSIPEIDNDLIYNTSYTFNPKGEIIGKHRKVHLFDIQVKGGISFQESLTLTAGNSTTVVDTEFGKIGVAICYDVRFPELFRKMALEGAKLIILPAAFNMTTGPAHWELTMRARAMDNQVYFAAVSPARDVNSPYVAYGNSCAVTPWGEFCAKTDWQEGVLCANIDFDYVDDIREQLPLLKHRKPECY